jgi:urease accessory protein
MLFASSISGNIYSDSILAQEFKLQKQNLSYKRLILSRHEMEKTRFRKKTEDGTDIGVNLLPQTRLRHGDIISTDSVRILIEQLPEKVITVKLKEQTNNSKLYVMLGHIIGNRHRPISYEDGGIVSFPIYNETELELFKSLFKDIIDKIEMVVEEKIFQPHKAMNVHEHG